MREIKFRVWGLTTHRMMIADPKSNIDVVLNLSGEMLKIDTIDGGIDPSEPVELSQFTGLHDSKGVEIYDGDIVRSADTGFMYIVEWSSEVPGWEPFLWDLSAEDGRLSGRQVTVVGNRWENPTLAEEVEG